MSTTDEAALLKAVQHALAGDWQAAHEIVQAREGEPAADWIHAVVHRIEGDLGNARYWYRQCGCALPEGRSVDDELHAIRAALGTAGARPGPDRGTPRP